MSVVGHHSLMIRACLMTPNPLLQPTPASGRR